MAKFNNISIENIYYMLSYAFTNLRQHCNIDMHVEKFDTIGNLFAVILYKEISSQIKRGLYKTYETDVKIQHNIKGKINFTQSIKMNTLQQKKLACHVDEFIANTLLNQILKATCLILVKDKEVNLEHKKALKSLLYYFTSIDDINVRSIKWSNISYYRNNATYVVLINICYLIIHSLLFTEKKGKYKLYQYLDDTAINLLYEKFVLAYYKKHFPKLHAKSSYIDWIYTDITNNLQYTKGEDHILFLPRMKTDIMLSLQNKAGSTYTLIIDTKFYSNIMQKRYDRETYNSNNLYQIFSYVKNKDILNKGNVSGMLLYANTDNSNTPEKDYLLSGNKISVRTLDLNLSWCYIKEKLDSIANRFISDSCCET